MKKLLFPIVLLLTHISFAQSKTWQEDATPLHRAQKALTDVIIHDIFSPPVASRIYAYTNIAAYEVLVKQHGDYNSLHNQVKGFPQIPAPAVKVCNSLAA